MAYGLEVYNSSGTAILTGADRIERLVASFTGTLTAPANSSLAQVSLFIPYTGVALDGTWYTSCNPIGLVGSPTTDGIWLILWSYNTTAGSIQPGSTFTYIVDLYRI